MGEKLEDRLGLLMQLSNQNPHPESVPINALQRVEGTPLADQPPIDVIEFVRMVATARILVREQMRQCLQRVAPATGAIFSLRFVSVPADQKSDRQMQQVAERRLLM